MQLINAILPAFLMATAAAQIERWTIYDITRSCVTDNSVCTFNFLIDNTIYAEDTDCSLNTSGPRGQGTAICGPFDITAAWDAREYGNGVMRLVIRDQSRGLLVRAPISDGHFPPREGIPAPSITLGTAPA